MIKQLLKIYYEEETRFKKKMSYIEAEKYHRHLLTNKNILCVVRQGKITTYIEYYKVNYEQLQRLIWHESFNVMNEDLVTGQHCYVANIWVSKDSRFSALKELKYKWDKEINKCLTISGHRYKYNGKTRFYKRGNND